MTGMRELEKLVEGLKALKGGPSKFDAQQTSELIDALARGFDAQRDLVKARAAIDSLSSQVAELREALGDVLLWAEVGQFLYEGCSYAYGDGYDQPRELTINWEWQQSKPNTSGGEELFKEAEAWLAEQREYGSDLPVFKARALSSEQTGG